MKPNATGAANPSLALRLLAADHPLVIGHRGCCEFAPENTLPSFQLALDAGADLVELDARQSKDGALVVIHDHDLDRTTDATSRWRRKKISVESRTAADLLTLDAGKWFDSKFTGVRLSLLDEALDFVRAGDRVTLIERKTGDAKAYVDLLREKSRINQAVVIAFDWEFLHEVHKLEPSLVLGALGPATKLTDGRKPLRLARKLSAQWLDQMRATGAQLIVWNPQVSKETVASAHQRGLKVWVYTVNQPALANKLLDLGVDGIISNNPALIRKTAALRTGK